VLTVVDSMKYGALQGMNVFTIMNHAAIHLWRRRHYGAPPSPPVWPPKLTVAPICQSMGLFCKPVPRLPKVKAKKGNVFNLRINASSQFLLIAPNSFLLKPHQPNAGTVFADQERHVLPRRSALPGTHFAPVQTRALKAPSRTEISQLLIVEVFTGVRILINVSPEFQIALTFQSVRTRAISFAQMEHASLPFTIVWLLLLLFAKTLRFYVPIFEHAPSHFQLVLIHTRRLALLASLFARMGTAGKPAQKTQK